MAMSSRPATLLAILSLSIAGSANAGALYLNEFADRTMGTAGAGAQAWADDASTSWHNPAGLMRLKGHQLTGGFGLLFSDIKFDPDANTPVPGNDGGQQGGVAPIAGLFYSHDLHDRVRLGADFNALSGAVLDPDNDWAGRFQNQKLELLIMELGLNVAVRVTDWLSVGAGPRFQYSSMDYITATPPGVRVNFDELNDFVVTWKAGVLIEFSERTRFGVNVLGESEPDLSGDVKFRPTPISASINTELTLPLQVRGGLYHEFNDQWAGLVSVGWEQWSSFDDQFVSIGSGSGAISRNLDDTWYVSVGAHYRPTDRWLLTAGFAYDTDPSRSEDRTAEMALDRQFRGSLGAFYDYTENLEIGAAFVYANYGDARIESSTLRGEFERNNLFFLNLVFNWKKTAWSD
jgi:long-chain fatty acid transport protein